MINDILLRAARGEQTERKPVWLMRQAGRILPQYRCLSEQVGSFITMVQTPEIACEVTLQSIDELGVDAAIIYSDILVIPETMGLPYKMEKNKGPVFMRTIQSAQDVEQLRIADEEGVKYTIDAIKLVKSALNNKIPLIGFAGAPWTIFAYMVEGSGCNGHFFIPGYPTLLTAIQFDRTGTTRIGKYVLNHSFMIPGLVTTTVSVVAGLLLKSILL